MYYTNAVFIYIMTSSIEHEENRYENIGCRISKDRNFKRT